MGIPRTQVCSYKLKFLSIIEAFHLHVCSVGFFGFSFGMMSMVIQDRKQQNLHLSKSFSISTYFKLFLKFRMYNFIIEETTHTYICSKFHTNTHIHIAQKQICNFITQNEIQNYILQICIPYIPKILKAKKLYPSYNNITTQTINTSHLPALSK